MHSCPRVAQLCEAARLGLQPFQPRPVHARPSDARSLVLRLLIYAERAGVSRGPVARGRVAFPPAARERRPWGTVYGQILSGRTLRLAPAAPGRPSPLQLDIQSTP